MHRQQSLLVVFVHLHLVFLDLGCAKRIMTGLERSTFSVLIKQREFSNELLMKLFYLIPLSQLVLLTDPCHILTRGHA